MAGQANVLVVPNIEVGDMLAKQLTFMAGAVAAEILLGAQVPIILNNAAASERTHEWLLPPLRWYWPTQRLPAPSLRPDSILYPCPPLPSSHFDTGWPLILAAKPDRGLQHSRSGLAAGPDTPATFEQAQGDQAPSPLNAGGESIGDSYLTQLIEQGLQSMPISGSRWSG